MDKESRRLLLLSGGKPDERSNDAAPQKKQRERSSFFEVTKEDSFEIQDHFDRLKVSELSCAILAVFGFACASMIYDITYPAAVTGDSELTIDYLFGLCTASTGLLLLSIVWRTYLEYTVQTSSQ